jgi:hypothetical protein
LVPGGGAGELATPPLAPLEPPTPPVACASDAAVVPTRARITTNALPERLLADAAIVTSPSPINRRAGEGFRNQCRRSSLITAAAITRKLIALRPAAKGPSIMSDRDPFAEGERAARENIPAEANPYPGGSDEHALWSAGHERVASAREARESEQG